MKRTLATLLFIACSFGLATAEPQRLNVRGTIAAITGDTLTVTTANGPQTVLVPPDVRISLVVSAKLSDIAAGGYVGAAAVPQSDGTLRALEVHVLPAGTAPGSHPYDLAPGSSMTNGSVTKLGSAKVDAVDARVLTVTYDGGEKQIVVAPGTPVVTFVPGTHDALVAGAHVFIAATKSDAGTVTAQRVSVGKDGLTPPM